MNQVTLIGRLTRDPEVRVTNAGADGQLTISRYTLAVDRRYKQAEGQPTADFIPCVAMGKQGEFAERYLHQGMKIAVTGRIQTGSYTNKDGIKIYHTDVIVDTHEFVESKGDSKTTQPANDDFMAVDDEGLPFN